ncbi:hypothetical protein F4803DRAFT_567955 [Xylaria telfairii]|nr:hypothetical protein F4803DRAFT_567955 [Xylaria telfairii]
MPKYPGLTRLKALVKEKCISGKDSKTKFLPANTLEELVTRTTVLSAFKEVGITEETELNRLTQSILKGRQRLFLILKLSSIRDDEWNEISDESLPFSETDNGFSVETTDGSGTRDFVPKGWVDNDFMLFITLQQPLLAPVFGTVDKFVHVLTETHPLPYLSISAGPKSSGFFSEVWRAEIHIAHIDPRHIPAESVRGGSSPDSIPVAIKTARDAKELLEFFDKEAQNLERVQKFNSEHIIKPIAAYQRGTARCLLFPWASGGNLATYWEEHDKTRSDRKNLRWVMKQLVGICSALVVLHKDANNGYPENILWFTDNNERGCLKIADMGLSTFHDSEANTKQRNKDNLMTNTPSGTFRYEPPEMDKDRESRKPRSRQYDIWSMGCIMIELLIWLLYGYEDVDRFRRATTQFWERTSATTNYHVSSYVKACLDSMEEDLGERNVYRSLLGIVRHRVLVVDVSDEYKSSPDHREIALKLHAEMEKIQQMPDDWYKIPSDLRYPDNRIQERRKAYFLPGSEGGKLSDGASKAQARLPDNSQDHPPTGSEDVKEPTKFDDIWESIPDNYFARGLFNSLSWDAVKPPVEHRTPTLCSNCNAINSAHLFKANINRNELESSSRDCDLCRLLHDALRTQKKDLSTVISLRQDGSLVSIRDGPNLLSIYIDPGAQLGLPKLPDHGSREQFLLLKEWIQVCNSTHKTCDRFDTEETGEKSVSTNMPTRLVDLGNPLRLADSSCIKPSPYVALSHCWGKTETLCTTTKNITQFKKSIDFSSLPKTFRDAIEVTRGIGIQYLWIDSLCIIQDDEDDWEYESTQMEQVFSFAYCTIGASSSKSSIEGFLHNRRPRSCVQLEVTGIGRLYVCQNIDNFNRDVEQGELNSRGWVLQERALSRRSIFYTTTQVYWECGAGVHCETLARLKNPKAALLGDARFPNSALEYYRGGRQMLVQFLYERYSRLAFTHSWDRPLAILGLQKRLAKAFKTQGAYGLFTTYFARLLLWKRSGPRPMMRIEQRSAPRHRAPTWSWFSKMGAIEYLDLKFQEIDWTTDDFTNPLMEADLGEVPVTLRGKVRNLIPPEGGLVSCITLDEGKEEDANFNDLKCIVIGRDKALRNPGDNKYHTLIVRRVYAETADIYERAGVASLKAEHVAEEGCWNIIQ